MLAVFSLVVLGCLSTTAGGAAAAWEEDMVDVDGHVARRLSTATVWSPSQEIETLIDASSVDESCVFGGISFNGAAASDNAGFAVTSPGDVNGDGYDDILIGAYMASPGGRSEAGTTYLIFGSANMTDYLGQFELSTLAAGDGSMAVVFNGADADDWSGRVLGPAGDVDGDGYADFLIGAQRATSSGKSQAGETYLIFGSATLGTDLGGTFELSTLEAGDGSVGVVLKGVDAFDESGRSVSSAGDVDGDGYDDFLIGAPYAERGSRNQAGEAYLIFGSATFGSDAGGTLSLSSLLTGGGVTFRGADAEDQAGFSVHSAGDVNHDGYSDFLISAVTATANGFAESGEVYLLFGSPTIEADLGPVYVFTNLMSGDGSVGVVFKGIGAGDQTGFSVSSAKDVDQDGYDDFIIGARDATFDGKSEAGRAFLIFGTSTIGADLGPNFELSTLVAGDGSIGVVFNGVDANDFTARRVSEAGDVNADGFPDVLIGARLADPGGVDRAGSTYLIYGSATIRSDLGGVFELSSLATGAGSRGVVFTGIDAVDESSRSLHTAGDVNGDGADDILIGAWRADPGGRNAAGETYLIFGIPTACSLVASYFLDGNADDMSGNGFHCTIEGGGSFGPDRHGVPSSAYVLDGVDDYVACPESVTADVLGDAPRTICAWARNDDPDSGGSVFQYGGSGVCSYFSVRLVGSSDGIDLVGDWLVWTNGQDEGCNLVFEDLIPVPEDPDAPVPWHHHCLVFEGAETNTVRYYLDGMLRGAYEPGDGVDYVLDTGDARPLEFGRWSGGDYFTGAIDDVSLWLRAFSGAEISALYWSDATLAPTSLEPSAAPTATPTTLAPTATPSIAPTSFTPTLAPTSFAPSIAPSSVPTLHPLVASYDFDGGAADGSGNGLDCTLRNGATFGPDRHGVADSAYVLDGVDDFVTCPAGVTENIRGDNERTICVWARSDDADTGGSLFWYGGNALCSFFSVRLIGPTDTVGELGDWILWTNGQGAGCNLLITNTTDAERTGWHQHCLTYEGAETNTINYYLDGYPRASYEPGAPTSRVLFTGDRRNLEFGRWVDGRDEDYFTGALDDASVWTRALTPSQIEELYWSQATASPTTAAPTFIAPTQYPSLSPTTSGPSMTPTQSPTTLAPTSHPTLSPTTSLPTATPTTSTPSIAPSSAPTGHPLLASYAFDGNVDDGSGNDYDCTLRNGATFGPDRYGVPNGAVLMDGVDDFVRCPFAVTSSILGDNKRTVCAWAENTDNSTGGAVFQYGGSGACSYFSVRLVGPGDSIGDIGDWLIWANGQGAGCNLFITNTTDEERVGWHQHCLAYEGAATNTVNYYLDGYLRASYEPGALTGVTLNTGNTRPLEFGRWAGADYFTGSVDDAAVWMTTLTPAQIEELYWSQATASPTTAAPSTAAPSDSPTTSSPTSFPTLSPTTASPSEAPSRSPTTSAPSIAPTTSYPTFVPTASPTTSTPTSAPTTGTCPRGFDLVEYSGTGNCYSLTSLAVTSWFECYFNCYTFGTDLSMPCVTSAAQNTALRNYYSEAGPYWLGYADYDADGIFEWTPGCASGYTNWRSGDPDRAPDNGFAFVTASGDWRDRNADAGTLYACICETPPDFS